MGFKGWWPSYRRPRQRVPPQWHVTHPMLGTACQFHSSSYIRSESSMWNCGLTIPPQDFRDFRLLDLVLKLGGSIPGELRNMIYGNLFPWLTLSTQLWINSDNLIKRRSTSAPNDIPRTHDPHFCYIQGIIEKFGRIARGDVFDPRIIKQGEIWVTVRDAAQVVLDDLLGLLGRHFVLQVKCWESADHKKSVWNFHHLSRSWLRHMSPLRKHIRYLTLDLAVTEDSTLYDRESIRLSDYIASTYQNLEKVELWLHLSQELIELAICATEQQPWINACQKLASGLKATNFSVHLTQITEGAKNDDEKWGPGSNYMWDDVKDQRLKRRMSYWEENLQIDETLLEGLLMP